MLFCFDCVCFTFSALCRTCTLHHVVNCALLGLVELNLSIIRRKPFVYDQNSAKPRSTQHGKNGAHLERVTVVLAG